MLGPTKTSLNTNMTVLMYVIKCDFGGVSLCLSVCYISSKTTKRKGIKLGRIDHYPKEHHKDVRDVTMTSQLKITL